ncbi:MAG TPA: FtsX-like permease family protein, partial [Steroidobacteraceae bacterium]
MSGAARDVMKSLPLVVAALRRKPLRTLLTMLGVVIAFLLFGLLQGVDSAFELTIERLKLDRVFVDARFSQPLPLAYRDKIARIPGVIRLTPISFLDGYYRDPKNEVLVIATTPEIWLGIRPEFSISKEQIEAVTRTRNGVIIADWLAREDGLKIGDQFTVRTRTGPATPDSDWMFVVVGIMTYSDPSQQMTSVLANFAYYDEGRTNDKGTASRFLVKIDDPRRSAGICREIDRLFATSGVQTRSQTEHEMGQSQIANVGDITFFTHSIVGAVFFTLMILTINTMMESVRERTCEIGVLKAIGFPNRAILMLVIMESTALCVTASILGLFLSAMLFPLARDYVDHTVIPPIVTLSGVA